MKAKVYLDVYGDENYCCDTMEWSKFGKCPFLDLEKGYGDPVCKVLRKRLDLLYTPSDDPQIEGTKVLKHQLCKHSLTKHDNQSDKFFITEILNDLHKNGFVHGGKAETMLHDWAAELREESRIKHPASRLKKEFAKQIGLENWNPPL
jgi:hypothetical protein